MTLLLDPPEHDVLQGLSDYIVAAKYARYMPDKKRREVWSEAVERVEGMHLRKFSHLGEGFAQEIREAHELVKAKRVAGSMRAMQFGGAAIEANNLRLFNCCASHIHSLESFSEYFYLLLCGTGAGISLTKKYLSRLPDLVEARDGESVFFDVPDTIEGWADSLYAVVASFFEGNEWSRKKVIPRFHLIRPKGSPLLTSGGKAPGPDGLDTALRRIKRLLGDLVAQGVKRLPSIAAYDICCHASDAVLSGGVRRSATIVLFEPHDSDMMNAKRGDWFKTNPQRARSNNSVIFDRKTCSLADVEMVLEATREWGDPGFYFLDDMDTATNPCGEVLLAPTTSAGEVGWGFCNLSSINGAAVQTPEDFYEVCRVAAFIGTLQASYTDFPYLSETSRQIAEAQALIGVSITGILANPGVLTDPEVLQRGARIVVEENERVAAIIGINPAARATTVKPEGTFSLVCATPFNGVHPAHGAPLLFRRVQMNRVEPMAQLIMETNPHMVEDSVYADTDISVTFPLEIPADSIVKSDLPAVEFLNLVRRVQENWVLPGSERHNPQEGAHSVSCTVPVREDEWGEVAKHLWEHRFDFGGISLLPEDGDKMHAQAPWEKVTTVEDLERWHYLKTHYAPMDFKELVEEDDATDLRGEAACAGGACEIR